MQIEQKLPSQSMEAIMQDPQKYRKIMLIIQQTLYDLGYHDSARMLQQESGVEYYTTELLQIKQHLQKDDYQAAIKVVEKLEVQHTQGPKSLPQDSNHNNIQLPSLKNNSNSTSKPTPIDQEPTNPPINSSPQKLSPTSLARVKSMIYETYCMSQILQNNFDQAMHIINQHIHNQAKRESLCQALVLNNHRLTETDLETKKLEIFNFCLAQYQDIGDKEIQKVIESYTQNNNDNNDLKKLLASSALLPPMKILTIECSEYIKHQITHMKFNPITEQLILVDQTKDFQQVLMLSFDHKNWQYQKQLSQSGHLSLKLKYAIFSPVFNREVAFIYKGKRQAIESVAFSSNKENMLLGLGSYSLIHIFNSRLDLIAEVQAQNKIEKFLCLQFNPISDLLYTCGYFEAMQVLDTTGQQIASIYPYPKTRKFLFRNSEAIGISLVTNKLYKHSIDEQVLIKEKQLDENAFPMDVCMNEKQDKLAISSLQFLYLIDADSLQILSKTVSPLNPSKLTIEIKFYGNLIITLAKNFTCYETKIDQSIESPKSFLISKLKQWSGDGTFDIHGELMISGAKEILCWQQADADLMVEEESEFEEEIENHQIRDMEGEEEEDDNSIDESDIQSNQDDENEEGSMDQEDEDISL